MEIKKIKAKDTYPVRNEVLRKGLPVETCHFNGDENTDTTHFGFYIENNLIGIISIFKEKHHLFPEEIQFQIRGMAVLEDYQGKGYGAQLVNVAESYCLDLGANLIWFNARERAVAFYQKLNYKIIGDSFEIPNVGIHFVMYKKIQKN